jgi:single-strand DNA-binding protein
MPKPNLLLPASNRRWKDQQTGDWKEETDWTNVVLWRQENLANYLTRGKQVFVEGRLHTRSYDDKDGKKVWATEVVAEDVILLGRGEGSAEGSGAVSAPRGSQAPQTGGGGGPRPAEEPAPAEHGVTDDDIPF